MSVRSVGSQSPQPTPGPIPEGASRAPASLPIDVAPDNDVPVTSSRSFTKLSASGMPQGTSVPTLRAAVTPSGHGIFLIAEDGTGEPTGITAFPSPSEVQEIRLLAAPSGGGPYPAGSGSLSFTLSYMGQTTAPIPVSISTTEVHVDWTVATTPNHVYDLAVTFLANIYGASLFCFETIDGANVVVRADLPGNHGSAYPPLNGVSDAGVVDGNGNPIVFAPIASAVKASGTRLTVRFTAGPGGYPASFDALRVHDSTANTIAYLDDTAAAVIDDFGVDSYVSPSAMAYGGGVTNLNYNSGVGPVVVVTGGGATIQAALEALPAIGVGGVSVGQGTAVAAQTAPYNISGIYPVTFTNPDPRPLFTCADPAVSIVQTSSGLGAHLTINGGTPSLTDSWVWGSWHNGGTGQVQPAGGEMPYALLPLFQSAPAVQTFKVNELPYVGNEDLNFLDANSYSIVPAAAYSPGATIGYSVEAVPPGTYQVAITWSTAISYPFRTCVPNTATHATIQDGTGATLATVTPFDQSIAPASYTDPATGRPMHILGSVTFTAPLNTLNVKLTTEGIAEANPQPVAVLDAMQLTRTSPDASITLGPGDVATLDIPAGLISTTAGPIPAMTVTVQTVNPPPILPPFVPSAKTLRIGYNVEPAPYYCNFATHSNLAYLISFAWPVMDADGYPTRIRAGRDGGGVLQLPATSEALVVAGYPNPGIGDPRGGSAMCGPGLYVLTWDGDPSVTLANAGLTGTTVTEVSNNLAGKTSPIGNQRVYRMAVAPGSAGSPFFQLQVQSSTVDPANPTGDLCVVNLTNLKIYPPDPADPTGKTIWVNPPKFLPSFLDKVRGMQSLRFLDVVNTNSNPCRDFAHYKFTSHINRSGPQGSLPIAITSIQAPSGAAATYFPTLANRILFEVKTSVPHGLFDGCLVAFQGTGTAQFAGGPVDLTQLGATYTMAWVIDATTLLCSSTAFAPPGQPNINNTAMTNVLKGGMISAPALGSAWPLEDVADLITASGVPDFWLNLPTTIDSSPGGAVDQVIAYLAARIPSGVKIHVEYGNECWNTLFPTRVFCGLKNAIITRTDELAYTTAHALMMKAAHDRAVVAMTAAGRAGDLHRVIGTQGSTDNATDVFAKTKAIGAQAEEACTGVYYSNNPALGSYATAQLPIFDRMTVAQILDYMELNAVYGGYSACWVTNLLNQIASAGYVGMNATGYEGAISLMVPLHIDGTATPDFYRRQNAAKRHPRMYGVTLQFLQAYQDAGLVLWNYFNLNGGSGQYCWDAYESANQVRGTGDPVLDAVNLQHPWDKTLVLAETAGALRYWAGLVPTATTTTTTTTKLLPGRNGRVRTTGTPSSGLRMVKWR